MLIIYIYSALNLFTRWCLSLFTGALTSDEFYVNVKGAVETLLWSSLVLYVSSRVGLMA